MKKPRTGGYDNYSVRSATLVENYTYGAGRPNILMDPDLSLGKINFGTKSDQWYNGPGTLVQSLPDGSRFQNNYVFAPLRPSPYKNFGIDTRQIADYSVEQLLDNPLSIYTTNHSGEIPKFFAFDKPDNYSSMKNKPNNSYKKYFESSILDINSSPQEVYPTITGERLNPNADLVYNLNTNTRQNVNPMISLGSSKIQNTPSFSGLAYSGRFIPGDRVNMGGPEEPYIYDNYSYEPRTQMDQGFMNNNAQYVCNMDKSLSFANNLFLNNYN